jgi:hypothetical protein
LEEAVLVEVAVAEVEAEVLPLLDLEAVELAELADPFLL